ncbi:MAG TPA: retropepsin-like aspartic protease [Gemmataceae bacterium]|nr:retropepsin-like aspartic protease [Gemmataceae bacterium]
METPTMGRVTVAARIENIFDLYEVERGRLKPEQVRRVEVTDALVDTGATMLSLPKRLVAQLGLSLVRSRQARTSAGPTTLRVYDLVCLTVQGREYKGEVAEVPDDCPVIIGQVPLELLDFVVDPAGQRLIGNPEHGGEQMIDMY